MAGMTLDSQTGLEIRATDNSAKTEQGDSYNDNQSPWPIDENGEFVEGDEDDG